MLTIIRARAWAAGAALLAVAGIAGCTLEKQAAPELTGPSEFGLSLTMTATPDQMARDGQSQSVVTVSAHDASGQPWSGQQLFVAVTPSGTQLSQETLVTDSAGRATFAVIAPAVSVVVPDNRIVVSVRPIGGNFANAVPRTLPIGLLGPPNTTAPAAQFTFAPESPAATETVVFDASETTDEGFPCGDSCSYAWDFGGTGTASGRVVAHGFAAAGSYAVRLTVTDVSGATDTTFQAVTVVP